MVRERVRDRRGRLGQSFKPDAAHDLNHTISSIRGLAEPRPQPDVISRLSKSWNGSFHLHA